MNSNRFRSILIKIAKAVLILIILIAAGIGFIFQFVLTPEKITPKIVEALNENLNAEVSLEKAELTFFTTFPNFKLELNQGVVTPRDEYNQNTEPLIAFQRALVSINPISLLRNKLNIDEFEFRNPRIFARIDRNGKVNWNILKEPTAVDSIAEIEQNKSLDSSSAFVTSIQLKNIKVINGQVTFDDQFARNLILLDGFNIDLEAAYSEQDILLDLQAQTEQTTFKKQEKIYAEQFRLEIDTDLFVNREKNQIAIQNASIGLNDLYFDLLGDIQAKSVQKLLDVDLRFKLEAPSIQSLINVLPEDFIDKKANYIATGEVILNGQIAGMYGKDALPDLECDLLIREGSLYYQKKGRGIDQLDVEAALFLPSDAEKVSKVILKKMTVRGIGTDLSLKGSGKNLFDDPNLNLEFKGNLNLKTFQESVPLKKDIDMDGSVRLDLILELPTAVFRNEDYGDIYAVGNLDVKDLSLNNQSDHFSFAFDKLQLSSSQDQSSSLLEQVPGRALKGRVKLEGFKASILDSTSAQLQMFEGEFMTLIPQDSNRVSTVNASIKIDRARLKSGDSLKARIKSTVGEFKLSPQKQNPELPRISSSFRIDSTGAILNGKYASIIKGNYQLTSNKSGKKWPLSGIVDFDRLQAFTPAFPLDITLPTTTVTMTPGLIELDEARIILGNSDFTANGKIHDIGDAFLGEKEFQGELELFSDMIDVNEIIRALVTGAKERSIQNPDVLKKNKDTASADNMNSTVFIVPDNLDLTMDTHFKQVQFKHFDLKNVNGRITVKDQAIRLENLGLVTMAAKMATSIGYSNPNEHQANLDFDFKLHEIDLSKLTDMMPVLDSLLPMAGSFEGKVNFRMKGEAIMDQQMNMLATSMEAIARIEGDSLIILSGETFQKVAKMLRFKDTEGKHLDHMEFAMTFKDQTIEIFPSFLTIDRYQLALGGKHSLEDTYDYHISILKSPIPFKLGIDISGSGDDLDIKLAKARYKHLFSTKKKHLEKADPSIITRKKIVLDSLPFY